MGTLQAMEEHIQFLGKTPKSLEREIELWVFLRLRENVEKKKFPIPGMVLSLFEEFLRTRGLLVEPLNEYFNLDSWKRKPTWKALNSFARNAPIPLQIGSALRSVIHSCDAWAGRKRPKRDPNVRAERRESLRYCDLCWRFAGGAKPRCSYHRRSERSSYLRMSRIKPMFLDERLNTIEKIPFEIHPLTKENIGEWLGILEHAKKYLKERGANLENPDPREIIDLLDDDPSLPAIRIREHERIAENPEQLAGTLIDADTWLSLLEARHWGGKRAGAGRPKRLGNYQKKNENTPTH